MGKKFVIVLGVIYLILWKQTNRKKYYADNLLLMQ